MESSLNHFELMRLWKSHKIHSISWHSNSKLRIIFWMFIGIHKSLSIENIHIKMMSHLSEISIHHSNQILNLFRFSRS